MNPSEIQANETLQFVLENISSQRLRLLEVGCGSGALAKRLHDLGHEVIAIDSSAKAIDDAKRLGVDARVETNNPKFSEKKENASDVTKRLRNAQNGSRNIWQIDISFWINSRPE